MCDTKLAAEKFHDTTTHRSPQAYTGSENFEQKEISANITATVFI
jgi:hypothetical protein